MALSLFNASKNLTVQDPETALAVRETKPLTLMESVPSRAAARANARLIYCQRVVAYAREHFCSEPTAAAALSLHPCDFPLLSSAGKNGASALTYLNFRNWISKLGRNPDKSPNACNVAALIDGYFDREYRRAGDELWWQVFMRMVNNESKIPIVKCYRLACEATSSYNYRAPTFSQVRFFIKRKYPQAAFEWARRGEVWAENRLAHYVHRDWSAIAPGQVWVGDHHQLDCYVKYYDDETGKWRVGRPWLTAWVDIRSLYFVGFEIGLQSPNSITILRALAVGYCATGGKGPQHLYSDNGKDFKKLGLATDIEFDGHSHSICKSLGVNVCFALPYRGRSKPIERLFKEVSEGYCKTLPTYLGSRPSERPEIASSYETHPEDAPSLEEVQEGFFRWMMEVYHNKPQNGHIIGADDSGVKVAPAMLWQHRQALGRDWSDLRELRKAMRLPDTQTRKVGQGFCVRYLKRDYRAAGMSTALHGQWGKEVMIKIDTFDGSLYAYDTAGRYLCDLVEVPTVQAMFASESDEQSKLLSDELARARRDLKWAKSAALTETGLPVLISASDTVKLLTPGARLERGGDKMSVKGSSHKIVHWRVVIPGDEEDVVEAIPSAIETRALPAAAACPESVENNSVASELAERLKEIKRQQSQDQEYNND